MIEKDQREDYASAPIGTDFTWWDGNYDRKDEISKKEKKDRIPFYKTIADKRRKHKRQ